MVRNPFFLIFFQYNKWHRLVDIRRALRENREILEFNKGDFVADCAYRPCIITEMNPQGDVKVYQLTTGSISSCSLRDCGVTKISVDTANKMTEAYKSEGKEKMYQVFCEEMDQK